MTVSDGYSAQNGRVTAILGPNVLEVTLDDNRHRQVTLAGTSVVDLDDATKGLAKIELQRIAVDHDVEVLFHGFQADEMTSVAARVFVSHVGELNLVLLELGLVRYVPQPSALDWWTACQYEKVESGAKRNHRGVWSRSSEARSN